MPGYDKQIVIDTIRDELTRTTDGEDRRFDQRLAEWNEQRKKAISARERIVEEAGALIAASESADWKAVKKHAQAIGGERYESGLATAIKLDNDIPMRVRSARERALQRVVDILDSTEQATVTVADLRSFGVLDYVRNSNNAC